MSRDRGQCIGLAIAVGLAALSACGSSGFGDGFSQADASLADGGAADAVASDVERADAGALGAALGSFQLTYYWLAFEGDYSGPARKVLYDEQCTSLATVSAAFNDAIRIEGSGKLVDGRVLNYAGSCSCSNSPCYVEVGSSAPWGLGVQSISLRPFRSIAVDSTRIAIGSGVYIEQLDGLTMPGDSSIGMYVHDGCVVADDVGGAIRGSHIDFFAGLRAHYLIINQAIGGDMVTLRAGGSRCPGR